MVMIIICSPTKTLSLKTPEPISSPVFKEEAFEIMSVLKTLSLEELKKLYKVSDKVALQANNYIQIWPTINPLSAIYAFSGLQFKNLDIRSLDPEALDYAFKTIKITSGLYGILNAQDMIHPYRYDLENKLESLDVEHLYIVKVNAYLKSLNQEILDLTSKEYSVLLKDCEPVKVIFLEDDKQKGTVNKIFRGRLMRYCCQNKVQSIADIKAYTEDGFVFDEEHSSNKEYIFTRRTK